jgi:hypothetical protein
LPYLAVFVAVSLDDLVVGVLVRVAWVRRALCTTPYLLAPDVCYALPL